ncbi:MAG: hypothetical protein KF870_03135 [Leadbetterella sp.]|nr:hypothetical protein [Leadbetterella sp.]
MFRKLVTASFSLLCFQLSAQTETGRIIKIETRAGLYLSTSGKTPYLNQAGQYGLVPAEAGVFFLNGAVNKAYDSLHTPQNKLRPWGYSYGLEAQVNLSAHSRVLLPVAHISARYRGIELYAGRKRELLGLADSTGTWRSFIWSGNALPIPKIQLSTPGYIPLVARGLISAKMGYSHGWFGKQPYTEKYYLHQKWLYIKIGRADAKVNMYGGINQQAQWGGYSEILKDNFVSMNGYMPADAFTYLNVVLPLKSWKVPAGKHYPYEKEYRFGNHLGTIDLGLSLNLAGGTLRAFRQTPWEDGQAPEVFLSWDGNYTLMYEMKEGAALRKISLEWVSTQRQGLQISKMAKFLGWKEKHPSESQEYLNHSQYRDGWSYQGKGLGTPAIVPYTFLINSTKVEGFPNFSIDNQVTAPALTLAGKIKNINYTFHSGYIISSGLLNAPRPEKLRQFTSRLTGNFPLPKYGLQGRVDIGFDSGQLYGNQTGVNLAVSKRWR